MEKASKLENPQKEFYSNGASIRRSALTKSAKYNLTGNAQVQHIGYDKRILKVFLTHIQVTKSLTNFRLGFTMDGQAIRTKNEASSW